MMYLLLFLSSALFAQELKWSIPQLDNSPQNYVKVLSEKKTKVAVKKPRYFQKHPKVAYSNICKDPAFIQKDVEKYQLLKLPLVAAKPILKRVVVAIIDTGIDFRNKHLVQRIHKVKNFKSYDEYDFSAVNISGQIKTQDYDGHGSHVAGLILAAFPKAWILPLKYYQEEANGKANTKASIKALRFAIDSNVDVINYSGGGPVASKKELALLQEARDKNILVVVAAGNEKSNIDLMKHKYYPASYGLENLVVVGNLNTVTWTRDRSSNFGRTSVDIFAPGYAVLSYGINKVECAELRTGTSMSTPLVAGTLAYILATTHMSKMDAKAHLLKNSENWEQLQDFSKNGSVLSQIAGK